MILINNYQLIINSFVFLDWVSDKYKTIAITI